jgi:hypothetical protein
MSFQVHARLHYGDAFAFEKLSLKRSVRFANQNFAALAKNAMPGNSLARRSRSHSAAGASRSAWKVQGFSERPIG